MSQATLPDYSRTRLAKARGRENFPIAAWLLRPSRREARAAIYGFCRLVDDIGDERLGDPVGQLDRCREELEACYTGGPEHPVFVRLRPVIQRFNLRRDPFVRLIAANQQDQEVLTYSTWEELERYCDLSANPVGELVLALEGISDPERISLSDSICTGLQLVNMWQDVAADRERGRRYLPAEVLAQHGVDEADWWRGNPTPAMRAAMAHAVGRARSLLRQGWPLAAKTPGLMRLEMATFILSGLEASEGVLADGELVFQRKARLPRGSRRRALLGSLAALRAGRPGTA